MRILLLVFLLLVKPVMAGPVVHLTSLSWPPYADPQLPQQGASIAVARAAFAAVGYELVVDFYPWSRAVYLAGDEGSEYAGYFPEYFSQAISQEFIFSDAMGSGPLGLVQNAAKPLLWQNLADLTHFRIGVVKDYVNTREFDALVAANVLQVAEVLTDKSNIQKTAYLRIDGAVIDRNVLEFSLKTDPELQPLAGKVSFNERLLENKQLYVCFKKSRPEVARLFNEGLQKIDAAKIQADYLAGLK